MPKFVQRRRGFGTSALSGTATGDTLGHHGTAARPTHALLDGN
jgi:hypothetical protein